MRPADPFTPFLSHEDIRDRRVSNPSVGHIVDDLLEAPRRAALERRFIPHRTRWLAVVGLAISGLFLLQLFHLQIVRGANYRNQAEHNRLRRQSIAAPRGIIEDRQGKPLTINLPAFVVELTVRELSATQEQRAKVVSRLATILNLPVEEIQDRLSQPDADGTVTFEDITSAERAIKASVAFADTPGVSVRAEADRTYPLGEATSHLIGYIGKPTEADRRRGHASTVRLGKTGLEAVFQEELGGRDGFREIERDSENRPQRVVATEAPVPGNNLRLSIDADLQQRLYTTLTAAANRGRAPGGAAVAVNPQTGELLALVSVPGFDINALSRGLSTDAYQALVNDKRLPLFSRAVSGEYPSGSTIKPFIAAAALDQRVITPSTTVMSSGGLRVGSWFFPDWKAGGHGSTNVVKALAESVNTFFYMVGGGYEQFHGLGIEAMTAFIRRFGFGQPLGIDLPAEQTGFLPSKEWKEKVKQERWYIGDTYHFAIGQGDLLVTPLQLAMATAAVANGGTLYRPHLVISITDAQGRKIRTIAPEPLRSAVATPAALATVRAGMRQAVVNGSARGLNAVPVPVAGKTGTAQFGNGRQTHAWFTSFAPYDRPTIALTVLVEGGGEGHAAALPVARDVLSWYFSPR